MPRGAPKNVFEKQLKTRQDHDKKSFVSPVAFSQRRDTFLKVVVVLGISKQKEKMKQKGGKKRKGGGKRRDKPLCLGCPASTPEPGCPSFDVPQSSSGEEKERVQRRASFPSKGPQLAFQLSIPIHPVLLPCYSYLLLH